MKFRMIGKLGSALLLSTLSTTLYAQDCNLSRGQTDTNNDGYADQFVSPNATIINSNIDCSAHNISAGAFIRGSFISGAVTIGSEARVVAATVSDGAFIFQTAKIFNSEVSGIDTIVSARTVVQRSFVTGNSFVGTDIKITDSIVRNADVLSGSIVKDSNVDTFIVANDSRVFNTTFNGEGLFLSGNGRNTKYFGGTGNTGIRIDGPISIGSDSLLKARARISRLTNIGTRLRMGFDAFIGTNAEIGNNVTIGDRVFLQNFADIGNFTKIDNNASIGVRLTTGSGVRIGSSARILNNVTIGNKSVIGPSAVLREGVDIRQQVKIGERATIGANATVSWRAVVRDGANVPAGFKVFSNTTYPDDY